MIDRNDISAAHERLHPHIRRTPILRTAVAGFNVVLKLELLQHSGSFKPRGAFNRMLTAEVPEAGVVAASGGNHGAAVAFAARELGHTATIFVPGATPAAKVRRIEAYGAELVRGGAAYADALEASRAFQATSGALEVHAYDDPAVVAGQGTVGLELAEDAPDATHVLVAVGGGGLVGGIAAWFDGAGATVIGVEPETCPTFHAAKEAGQPVPVEVGGLAADSLGARTIGKVMFEVAQRTGVDSVLVSDAAIAQAQAYLWQNLRLISEPGGAAALAALLSGAWTPPTGAVPAIILCGANTQPEGFT